MSKLEFHPRRAWRALWSSASSEDLPTFDATRDLKAAYVDHVDRIKATMPHEAAMEHAIGAGFDLIGSIQSNLLRHYGLAPGQYVIDVGCGSGRLARPLGSWFEGRYLGVDLVPDLIDHARKIAGRPGWRFEVIDHIEIPEADGQADMVCFFSVMTHLLHEQAYWYLEEARRVLKPGGMLLFSFIEFAEPGHMPIFWSTLAAAKAGTPQPLNVFLERNTIHRFADALGLELLELRDGGAEIVEPANLGQALAVLRKPA